MVYFQGETPPETKGEKPQPSKDGEKKEEVEKKGQDEAGKENPKEETRPGNSPLFMHFKLTFELCQFSMVSKD